MLFERCLLSHRDFADLSAGLSILVYTANVFSTKITGRAYYLSALDFVQLQGIPEFCDFTICDTCYFVILFWASFHVFKE